MVTQPTENPPAAERFGMQRRLPFYYGWIVVGVAALAMTATLPGRTHGLGLITEPLIADLNIDRPTFAGINLFTCLLGAAFCLPVGSLLDRLGARIVLTGVMVGLGASVIAMAQATGPLTLFAALLVVRGLGQSALSVVSITAVGKWFRGRLGAAMGLYSVLLTFGFIGSILWMGSAVQTHGWRAAWAGMGWILLAVVAPVGWLLQRDSPEACGETLDAAPAVDHSIARPEFDFTLKQALSTPAFWVFALGTAAFNLTWSAVTLFNESILKERGFGRDTAVQAMAILTAAGLVSNLIGGALARRERLGTLLGIGMAVLTLALACFPAVTTLWQLRLYAAAMGLTGGLVTVIFFAAWGQVFGRFQLGRIQGAAQLISVVASAGGPLLPAECQARLGGYAPMFYGLAGLTAALSVAAFCVPLPELRSSGASKPDGDGAPASALPLTQET